MQRITHKIPHNTYINIDIFICLFVFWSNIYIANAQTIKKIGTKKIYEVDYKERGIASYIPDRFNMRESASGEPFDNSKLLAAHPHLPFKSTVKITNLKNKKSIVVTIIDRGPFAYGRMIDISKHAAERINMVEVGNMEVEMQVMTLPQSNNYANNNTKNDKEKNDKEKNDKEKNDKDTNHTSKEIDKNVNGYHTGKVYDTQGKKQVFSNWTVQVAFFQNFNSAKKHTKKLITQGLSPFMLYIYVENDQKYCVWYGNFINRREAEQIKSAILSQHNISGFLKIYKPN